MKKIGITTFFGNPYKASGRNYGAILQAYALQQIIKKLGYTSKIIRIPKPVLKNFKSTARSSSLTCLAEEKGVIKGLRKFFGRGKSFIRELRYRKHEILLQQKFSDFEKKYLEIQENNFSTVDELYTASFDFDTAVTGSDQVWNYMAPTSPEPYFLTFLPSSVNKIAYAPSLGLSNIPDKIKDIYRSWLSEFKYISMREDVGVELIQPLTNKKVIKVLDPTLLLSKDDWQSMEFSGNVAYQKYVLVYMLIESPQLLKIARYLGKVLGMQVICITSNPMSVGIYKEDLKVLYAGPSEFVNLIANASHVVTNSFHGTAFSLNFHKPFYSVLNRERKTNSRILSLLNMLILTDRIIYEDEVDEFIKHNSITEISLSYLECLVNEQGQSIVFLEKAIKME